MDLFVYDQGQQSGPFPGEQVQEMLRSGSLSTEAMVWHEGAPDWVPAATFFGPPVAVPPPIPAVRVVAAAAQHPAAQAVVRASGRARVPGEAVPTEGALFVRALGVGLGTAVLLGAGWAALQVVTQMMLQLPFIIGGAVGWLCGYAVSKASRDSAGWAWAGLAIGCAVVAWVVGIFGVMVAGAEPRIGLWTLVGFVFAIGSAWRAATE
jgi:hypothetical protein